VKAIVQDRFGPPESLRLREVDAPRLGPGDVLVRVRAAGVNPYDWHMLRGDPLVARYLGAGVGVRRPAAPVTGIDVAGEVAEVGADVRRLAPGDAVFGFCHGSFAEYGRAPAEVLVPKPARLSFEEAAALPMAAATALRGIRDVAGVRPGQRVLVNGAAGGVGTFAVQIAVALGAEVTAVCGPRNLELVQELGAARVVDHTAADFADGGVRYDAILDNVGNRPLRVLRRVLTPAGTLVLNGGGSPGGVVGVMGARVRAGLLDLVVRQRLKSLPYAESRENLTAVAELVEAEKLTPIIERTYPLAAAAEAVAHVERGHTRGKVVVTVA
jgi:NADPH:quinone reductase-like Zn-dependent oxidoreductase